MEQTQPTSHVTNVSAPLSVMWYALGGCAVGMLLGMLFAPKPGKETRDDITDWGRRSREKGRSLMNRIRESIPSRKQAKDVVQEALEEASEAVRS